MTTAQDWNVITADYEELVEPFTASFVEELLSPYEAMLPGSNLLDLACGSGAVSLHATFLKANVTATDFSQNFCHRVSNRCSNLDVVCCEGESLPASWTNSFDFVVSNFGVIFFADVIKGLREARRCLKPGGVLIISAWGSKAETAAFRVLPDATELLNLHKSSSSSSEPAKARANGSPESLIHLLAQAGFTNKPTIRGPITRPLIMKDPESYFERFARGAPGARQLLSVLSPEDSLKLKSTVILLVDARSNKSRPIILPASCYFASVSS